MLSSALFEDFTREVAARIIQHYWRGHMSAQASHQTVGTQANQASPDSAHELAEQDAQFAKAEDHGTEAQQEESWSDVLMRYRAQQSTTTEAISNWPRQLAADVAQSHSDHGLLESKSGAASLGSMIGGGPASSQLAQASATSLDRLKLQQGKQRRSMLQQATHDSQRGLQADVKLLPEASQQQQRSMPLARRSLNAATAQQAQQVADSSKQESGNPNQLAKSCAVTLSSSSVRNESSGGAVLDTLNPKLQMQQLGQSHNSARDSTGAECMQSPNSNATQRDAAVPQLEASENISPNLTLARALDKYLSHQSRAVADTAAAEQMQQDLSLAMSASDANQAPHVVGTLQATHRSSHQQKSGRLSSDKLVDIFAFLDKVEAQAEEEAVALLPHSADASTTSTCPLPPSEYSIPIASTSHPPLSHHQHHQQPQQASLQREVKRLAHDSTVKNAPPVEAAHSSSKPSMYGGQATGAGPGDKGPGDWGIQQTQAASGQMTSCAACITDAASKGQDFLPSLCRPEYSLN